MSSKNEDKRNSATKLRKEGLSYRQISDKIGVSKSNLHHWFKDEQWSQAVKDRLIKNYKISIRYKMALISSKAKENREKLYNQMSNDAVLSYEKYKKEILFISGLMTYWGEGDKSENNGQLRVANSDAAVVKYYYIFLKKYFPEISHKAKVYLVLYPDLNEKTCKQYWSKQIGISLDSFYKSQYIIGRSRRNKLAHGIGTLTVCSKAYKYRIFKWIELLEKDILKMR